MADVHVEPQQLAYTADDFKSCSAAVGALCSNVSTVPPAPAFGLLPQSINQVGSYGKQATQPREAAQVGFERECHRLHWAGRKKRGPYRSDDPGVNVC